MGKILMNSPTPPKGYKIVERPIPSKKPVPPPGFHLISGPPKDKEFSLKETAKSYGAGFGGGAGGIGQDILELIEQLGPAAGVLGELGPLGRKLGLKGSEELTENISEKIGARAPSTSAERIAEEAGKFGGQEALIGTALGGPLGGGAGAAHGSVTGALYGGLKELGIPDNWALGISAVATLSPIAARRMVDSYKAGKNIKKALGEAKKISPEITKSPEIAKVTKVIETYPSGLTKPKIAQKSPGIGQITKGREEAVIQKLNKEASNLSKTALKTHLPFSEALEKGVDYEEGFRKSFSKLEEAAAKYKPSIDLTPVNEFIAKETKQYRGISKQNLSPDERKIIGYIEAFRKRPTERLNRGLKIYRSNNERISKILNKNKGFEDSFTRFLRDFNKNLSESFRKTFPKNSEWVNEFDHYNKIYSEYKRAEEMRKKLRPIIKGEATTSNLIKIAEDPKLYKRLKLALGKEGADEIRQIATDLKEARKAIRSIPKETLKEFDAIYPLKWLINIPFYGLKKGASLLRKGYGYYLTTPAIRKEYDAVLKAVSHGNVEEYRRATNALDKETKLLEYKTKK